MTKLKYNKHKLLIVQLIGSPHQSANRRPRVGVRNCTAAGAAVSPSLGDLLSSIVNSSRSPSCLSDHFETTSSLPITCYRLIFLCGNKDTKQQPTKMALSDADVQKQVCLPFHLFLSLSGFPSIV